MQAICLQFAWWGAALTNDAEDAQNIRSKYHQHVDEGEQDDSDGDVSQPVESLGGEQHVLNGSSDLWTYTHRRAHKIPQGIFVRWALQVNKSTNLQGTTQ